MSGQARTFPDVAVTVEPSIEPYWTAATGGRLVLSRCAADGAALWPPRPFCPRHATAGVRWEEASGTGTVYSYSIVQRGEGAFGATAPYVLAVVELDEGPRVLTNLVQPDGAVADTAEIGMRVSARFEIRDGQVPVLRFTPQS